MLSYDLLQESLELLFSADGSIELVDDWTQSLFDLLNVLALVSKPFNQLVDVNIILDVLLGLCNRRSDIRNCFLLNCIRINRFPLYFKVRHNWYQISIFRRLLLVALRTDWREASLGFNLLRKGGLFWVQLMLIRQRIFRSLFNHDWVAERRFPKAK